MLSKSIQTQKAPCCMILFKYFSEKKKAIGTEIRPLVTRQMLIGHEGILESDRYFLYIDHSVVA